NNPLVIAIPANEGVILVDMAMSLFSYGKMEGYVREGKPLPVAGGWDTAGNLTDDAQAILESKRPLPIGFWKGTSLALMLDLVAASLSGGRTTEEISRMGDERGVSQVFVAMDLSSFDDRTEIERRISASLASINASEPIEAGSQVRWPGQNRLKIREENLRLGIPTNERVWKAILAL
ncbi:MAG: Ldh family oxidoreductase, partial [Sphaerochaeta sp.]|nr:Ldh family oxidoreductase [Sphaerochaeta sp.]